MTLEHLGLHSGSKSLLWSHKWSVTCPQCTWSSLFWKLYCKSSPAGTSWTRPPITTLISFWLLSGPAGNPYLNYPLLPPGSSNSSWVIRSLSWTHYKPIPCTKSSGPTNKEINRHWLAARIRSHGAALLCSCSISFLLICGLVRIGLNPTRGREWKISDLVYGSGWCNEFMI